MKQTHLSHIKLEGFKSIKECDIQLDNLNVLIGANGAGKSNFIDFFRLIQQTLEGRLQSYISRNGGPDSFLYFGRKKTEHLKCDLRFGNNGYQFTLEPTVDNRMMFTTEDFWWNVTGTFHIAAGHFESLVEIKKSVTRIYNYTVPTMKKWRVYHFHDTSDSAFVKQLHLVNDHAYLRPDARNLAAFLFHLQKHFNDSYLRIINTIRLVAPFFGDFWLQENIDNPDQIELQWTEKGEDIPFKAHHLSDGTIRFICLVTVLLQPTELKPDTIIIDEPELGLHPYAIDLLASLFKSVSHDTQIIVSTQSVNLLNHFDSSQIIVTEHLERSSHFRRLEVSELSEWLKEYSIGELWEKNILGGRPSR